MEWILELNSRAKEIIESSGYNLEMVYVGKRKKKNTTSQHLNYNIVAKIEDGDIASPLPFTKMQFFWIRLESMRRSKLRLGLAVDTDHVLQEVSRMIEMDDKGEDWAVIGRGSLEGIGRVEDVKLMECLDKYFSDSFGEPNKPLLVDSEPCCDHSKLISKEDEKQEQRRDMEFCDKCGHLMKKFFIYKPSDT